MHLSPRVIQAKILMGSHVGQVVCLPRINVDTNDDTKGAPFILRRRQYPVRPAFAHHDHKQISGADLQKSRNLLAVLALSRVGDPTNITMMVTQPPLRSTKRWIKHEGSTQPKQQPSVESRRDSDCNQPA
ncbi:hypothetical protein VYU27_009674 [Nannochloropsis oceanica]